MPAQFSVGASGDAPQYQWFKNGAPIDGARHPIYTIASAQEADEDTYSVIVSNLAQSVMSSSVVLIVTPPPNAPPVLDAIGDRSVNEGEMLQFSATALDPDRPTQALSFSLDLGAPSGAMITPTGAFSWVPTEDQGPGNYPVTVFVTDDGVPPLSDFKTITITVNEVNTPPVLGPIGDRTVSAGAEVSFTVEATDADLPGQTLTFSLDAGAPAGAGIHPVTGLFTWTAAAGVQATNSFTVRVTDSGAKPLSASETFAIVGTLARTSLSIVLTIDGAVVLSWETIPGQTYRLSYSENLGSGLWFPLGPDQKATSNIEIRTDEIGAHQQRFYRVTQLD